MTELFDAFPGSSKAVELLREQILRIASTNLPVFIHGETGTGKSLAAQLIHTLSKRSAHSILSPSLTGKPDDLLMDELVGHEKGAFAGAIGDRSGVFEIASGGTIVLEDFDNSSQNIQAVLLRLFDGEARRLGGTKDRKFDVRVIATTTMNLEDLLRTGRLRLDLFFRMNAIVLKIPPLKDRVSDIPILADKLLAEISREVGGPFELTASAVAKLQTYSYPGNIRELKNILNRAAISTVDSKIDERVISDSFDIGLPMESTREVVSAPTGITEEAEIQPGKLERELEVLRSTSITAKPIWQGTRFSTLHDYCFVLMPFGDISQVQDVFRNHVKKVVERCGLRCERADDIYDVSGVMQSVWEGINRARFIIADLTDRNPNVFYELGIGHTLGKQVIMLSQSIDFVPCDLRHLRCIVYSYTPPGMKKLETALSSTIKTLLSSGAGLA